MLLTKFKIKIVCFELLIKSVVMEGFVTFKNCVYKLLSRILQIARILMWWIISESSLS